MQVLIVEDDSELATELAVQLERVGHQVAAIVGSLSAARDTCIQVYPEILILDRLLPDGNGLDLIPWLRAHCPDTRVLVLSALAELEARVGGLNAGADDYLGKPYAEVELLARIAALARRHEPSGTKLHYGPLLLDRLARTAGLGLDKLRLNPREFSLLEYFILHAGETLTRTMILRNVWGYDFDPGTNVIDVHISRLRAKLDEYGGADMLITERGVGYRLVDDNEK